MTLRLLCPFRAFALRAPTLYRILCCCPTVHDLAIFACTLLKKVVLANIFQSITLQFTLCFSTSFGRFVFKSHLNHGVVSWLHVIKLLILLQLLVDFLSISAAWIAVLIIRKTANVFLSFAIIAVLISLLIVSFNDIVLSILVFRLIDKRLGPIAPAWHSHMIHSIDLEPALRAASWFFFLRLTLVFHKTHVCEPLVPGFVVRLKRRRASSRDSFWTTVFDISLYSPPPSI